MKRLVLLFLMVGLTVLSAGCKKQAMTIQNAWAIPGSIGGNSAVYFTVNNASSHGDQLLGGSASVAQTSEIQMAIKLTDGKQTILKQAAVPIPANKKILFEPDRLFLALNNLTQNLKAGDQIALTLKFEKAGDITLSVKVKSP